MNKTVFRALAVLVPLGAAALWIPLQDAPRPAWIVAPILLFAARAAAGAFDRAAGRPGGVFPGEEQVYAAPFAVRILTLLSAPGASELPAAAVLWAAFGAAAYSAEAALTRSRRGGLAVFTAALAAAAAAAAVVGAAAAVAGSVLAAAALLYAARRRVRA